MKQRMEHPIGKHSAILCIIVLLFCFIACTTETYESGDGDYSYLRGDFSLMTTNSKSQITYFVTDEDKTVFLPSPISVDGLKADTTYRAVMYYKEPTNADVELFNLKLVNVCKPFTLDHVEDMKTDPVGWESMWISNNKAYLNLSLNLLVGVEDGQNSIGKQVLGVRQDSIIGRHVYYTFYHDQNDVPEYYTNTAYVSVPLDESFPQCDTITMTVNTYDGIKQKTVSLP